MYTVVAPLSLLNTSKLRRRLSLEIPEVKMSISARTSARSSWGDSPGGFSRLKSTEAILPNGSVIRDWASVTPLASMKPE